MNRAELERRLVEDEDLRGLLETLRKVRDNVDEAEMQLADRRLRLYEMICILVAVHGLPPAFVARQVGLSPQRVNGILKQALPEMADTKPEPVEAGEVRWAADQVRRSRQPVQDEKEPDIAESLRSATRRVAEDLEIPVEEETQR